MKIARIVLVVLATLLMTVSGVADLLQPPPLVDGFKALALPMTVATAVGVGKLAGVLAILATSFVPAAPRWLREWAWAGFCIDLAAASLVHVLSNDAAHVANPAVMLVFMAVVSVLDRKGLEAAARASS